MKRGVFTAAARRGAARFQQRQMWECSCGKVLYSLGHFAHQKMHAKLGDGHRWVREPPPVAPLQNHRDEDLLDSDFEDL